MANPKKNMAGKSPLICIIEDETDLREIYGLKFRNEGFQVIEAGDGVEGVEVLTGQKPDIILLDIIMPRMNGYDLLRHIRNDENLKSVPVFILTNLSQEIEVKEGLRLAANKYFIKANYTPEELVTKVKEYLSGGVK